MSLSFSLICSFMLTSTAYTCDVTLLESSIQELNLNVAPVIGSFKTCSSSEEEKLKSAQSLLYSQLKALNEQFSLQDKQIANHPVNNATPGKSQQKNLKYQMETTKYVLSCIEDRLKKFPLTILCTTNSNRKCQKTSPAFYQDNKRKIGATLMSAGIFPDYIKASNTIWICTENLNIKTLNIQVLAGFLFHEVSHLCDTLDYEYYHSNVKPAGDEDTVTYNIDKFNRTETDWSEDASSYDLWFRHGFCIPSMNCKK